MHTATNDSINCIIKIIISSPYTIDYQIWYDHQPDDQIHHQKPSTTEVIETIWPRPPPYSPAARSQSRVVPPQKSLIHFGTSAPTTHFSPSAPATHFFRLYNTTSPLTSSSSFLFLFISLHTPKTTPDTLLFFLFVLFLLLFCFWPFALLPQTLNWLQSDYLIFALLLQILNWFISCFSLKLLSLRIS